MAFEPGGYAEKLGNRYEGRWVVKQLLRLLNEELMYVAIEPVGEDEAGVDLWLTKHNGQRQAQQCKARNGSQESWAVADLNRQGILAAIRRQLARRDTHEFALVSAVPATGLGDICESARQSTGDPESFFQDQIEAKGEPRRKAFRQFCEYLGLDAGNPIGRAMAHGYLQRTHVILWPDDQNSRDELLAWAGMLATGKREAVIAALAEYAQNNLRKDITSNDVRQHLSSLGHHPRRLAHDARVGPAVEQLQAQFAQSVQPGLVAGRLIQREETTEVLDGLRSDGVVVLHGAAGCGKTGVLYELTELLRQQGNGYIPVRLDRRIPANTPRQFGHDLGLPESPAWCLESLAGDAAAVLVLDQLDALRWTSAHSANALDVCKSLVLEVRNLRDLGKDICVVLACRTFDLEHDPDIRKWLKDSSRLKCRRVEVKPLPEPAVKGVVESLGQDFAAMSPKQKQILQSPQHLSMWVEIAGEGAVQPFQTGVQLMRQFWDTRYRVLAAAGIPAAQVDDLVDLLADHMEREGVPSAPRSLVARRPRELDAMQSHGVLQTTAGRVSFCHQSYLDFRIASRLLEEIYQGAGSVRDWLGDKSQQSLFRREQLRQVLTVLSEESPQDFLATVRELLNDAGVRFHLKHLVLEIVGEIAQPEPALLGYLRQLLGDGDWRDHVIEAVCFGHRQYIEWLAREGILSTWLESEEESRVGIACGLLHGLAAKSPDFVTGILEPYAARDDEWAKRVLGCLCWSVDDDSDCMFSLRLQLARRGIAKDFVSWPHLVAKHPLRAIRLIEAIVSTWAIEDFQGDDATGPRGRRKANSQLEQWTTKDRDALKTVAAIHPDQVWEAFLPHVERLTQPRGEDDRHIYAWQDGCLHVHRGYTSTARGMVELTIEAGRTLAQRDGGAILSKIRAAQDSKSPITQFILAEVCAALPGKHADEALNWLMTDSARLSLGAGEKEPEWMPAARLIAAQSPHCSEEMFRRLESWLVHHHEPNERRRAEWCVEDWKRGFFDHFWGKAQYFLLPALCPRRRLPQTTDLIGVLERKFAGYERSRFLRMAPAIGGWVGSPIQPDRTAHLSDKAWLAIISSKEISSEKTRRWKQMGPDAVGEASTRTFSRDLARLAKRFPHRFGRLSLRFPPDVHPDYVRAILEGMRETEPRDVPEAEKAAWRPADKELVESVLARSGDKEDRGIAIEFCRLVRDRAEEVWSDNTIAKLIHYATDHPDPAPEQLNTWPSERGPEVGKATIHSFLQNTLNCVRGVGALAVGALLRHHPGLLEQLKPCVDRLVSDPHPVVRTAAIEACLPVLNLDRDQAISWFCAASKDDPRVPASRAGVYFFNCGVQSHSGQLAPIIRQMLASEYDDVAQEGAEEVTARWLFHGLFEDELAACRDGTVPQRKGLAKMASIFLLKPEYSARCERILLPLYADEDGDVRRETQHAFRDERIFTIPEAQGAVAEYIKSKAFADDPSPLLWSLKEFSGSLKPFSELILLICEAFAGSLRGASNYCFGYTNRPRTKGTLRH